MNTKCVMVTKVKSLTLTCVAIVLTAGSEFGAGRHGRSDQYRRREARV